MIIKLKAGLGNQMFQYALGRLLEAQYEVKNIVFDDSYIKNYRKRAKLSSIEGLNVNYKVADRKKTRLYIASYMPPHTLRYRASVFIDKAIHKGYFFEKDRGYVDVVKLLKCNYIDGYWQSYRYVESIRSQLLHEFKTKELLSELTNKYIVNLLDKEAVMVGIRLGDYTEKKAKKHYFQSDNAYYNSAMRLVAEKVKDSQFIIFTNKVQECKDNYRFDYPVIYRENAEYINDYEELQVMRSCKHAIIAGSTFHWWGAWLIENPNKIVVRPPKWFIDDKPIDINPPESITIY